MKVNEIIEINGKRFVTVAALSDLLGVNKRTIQLWATTQDMPLIRVGNLMIFDLADITDWLIRHKSRVPI